jgi:hypothetical protein
MLGLDTTRTITIDTENILDLQVNNLLKRYLMREDRKDRVVSFAYHGGIKCVTESELDSPEPVVETNEIVCQKQTNLTIREFSNLIDRTANTSNRVYASDYLEIQEALMTLGKTVCYYVVYSETDKKFKDIIAVPINRSAFEYILVSASC